MASRSRRSIGGGALRDGASRYNATLGRAASRRQSFGGGGFDGKEEETTWMDTTRPVNKTAKQQRGEGETTQDV